MLPSNFIKPKAKAMFHSPFSASKNILFLLALSLLLTLLSGELQLLLYTILFLIIYAILRLLIYPASFSDEHGSMGVAGCGRVRVSGNGGYPRGNSIVSSQTDTWLLRHSDTPTPPHSHTPTRRHGLLFLLLGFLLFPPLSAFYLLPALRLSPILSRSLPVGQGHYSFMPTLAHLALMLNPALLSDFSPGIAPPWESVLYIGLAPMLLILRASCDTHSRRDFLLWGTLLVLAVLCSLQELKHVHILFSRIFPMLGAFRNPARLLYLVPFFGAILSARALHHLSCSSPSPLQSRSPAPWMCIFVAGIILFICASGWLSRQSDEILMNNYKVRFSALFGKGQLNPLDARIVQQEAISFRRDGLLSLRWQLALLVSLCSLFLIMERRVAQPKIFMLLLVGITVADLLYFARHYLETHSMNELYPPSALQEKIRGENISARLLDTSAPFAAAFWTDLPFFATAARGISRIDGYSPVNLSAYVRYIDTMTGLTNPYARWSITVPRIMHPELLSLLNGELLLSELPLDQPQWELVGEFRNVPLYKQFLGGLTVPHIFLYRNNASLPRAWLVPEAEICQPGMEGKRLLTTDPRQRVLIPPGAMALTDGEPYRPIPITPRTPNLVELELETRLPSYVCTGEIWAPGWTASDNGVRCEVLKINMLFRGLFLSPGKHHIFLSYRPPGFRTGMAISALTLALMLAGVAGARARRKI